MARRKGQALSELYEKDETAWLETMAELIERGQLDDLDYPHLKEYLEDMAARDRSEMYSRLVQLIAQLLKWDFQSSKKTRRAKANIVAQRQELRMDLDSGVLRRYAEEVLQKAFENAVEVAAAETELAADRFPKECPYKLEQLVSSVALRD